MNDVGVVGLAVMGQNLVLNIESKGYRVAVYNRSKSTTDNFIKYRGKNKKIQATYSYEELVKVLQRPRKIILMVKAGKSVDMVIESLIPYLNEGDIIIDGGNSYFKDTERRYKELSQKSIYFLGTGISGGEYGALYGPSIMPGGDKAAYEQVKDLLISIAARTEHGTCVNYLGERSAGHYVKMVHNGIEYAIMQAIAEAYDIMRKILNLEPIEMSKFFRKWNEVHQSYLLEITYKILERKDEVSGKPLVNLILDQAKQKGTGKWSVQEAFELGVPLPVITAAVTARNLSALKKEREAIGKVLGGLYKQNYEKEEVIKGLEGTLYLVSLIAYAEGMQLLQVASKEYNYGLKLDEVARIWENGCIIRSNFLGLIQKAYQADPQLNNLIRSEIFRNDFRDKSKQLRNLLILAKGFGVAIPAFSAALDYFDGLRSIELPANLVQAQRDYFGAHTYERNDKEGIFHTEWQNIKSTT